MSARASEIGTSIRGLMRRVSRTSFGTLERDGGGPYVSLAMVALGHDAAPLLLLSDLADHTRNLAADARVSLLFDGTLETAVPLAGERATLQGRIAKCGDVPSRARYLARHPDATAYAGFSDFSLYRVTIERAHLVAGFGRIHWVEGADVRCEPAEDATLEADEPGIVAHMNEDHTDAVQLYAQRLLGLSGGGWRMTGIDPEGADLRQGQHIARLPFDRFVHDAESARMELVRLVRRARAQADQDAPGDHQNGG